MGPGYLHDDDDSLAMILFNTLFPLLRAHEGQKPEGHGTARYGAWGKTKTT